MLFSIKVKNKFIAEFNVAYFKFREFTKRVIMIPGQIVNSGSLMDKIHDFFEHGRVRGGPISFGKLPNVDDVSV